MVDNHLIGTITMGEEIYGHLQNATLQGLSAYEVAVANGFTGTEAEWLASLKGETGETPNIQVGTVQTGRPGTNANANITGTKENPVLNMTVPRGDVGATPNITIGTVTTGEEGTDAEATITGTPENPVLNLSIPRGNTGNDGFDPVVQVTKSGNTATVSVTDATHTTEVNIVDGYTPQKGVDYFDGHSPAITASKSQGNTFIYLDGERIATIADGEDGYTPQKNIDYFDGHTPAISGEKIDDTTFIYADGVRIATVLDGLDGNSPVITTVKSGKTTSILADSVVIGIVSDGADGHSPTITTTKSGKITTILSDGNSIGTVSDGQDGHSPEITTNKVGKVLSIMSDGQMIGTVSDGQDAITPTITTDKSGTTTTIYSNGVAIGTVEDGADGSSPVITATKSEGITTIKANGVDIATINDGTAGDDGYSPTASVTKSGRVATITVTDKNGTTTAQVSDGQDGTPAIIDATPTEDSPNAVSSGGVYDELTDLKGSLKQTYGDCGSTVKPFFTVIDGKYITYLDYELNATTWIHSDYVDISKALDHKVTIRSTIYGQYAATVWYDEDKTKIGHVCGTNASEYDISSSKYLQDYTLTLPSDAKYVRFNGWTENIPEGDNISVSYTDSTVGGIIRQELDKKLDINQDVADAGKALVIGETGQIIFDQITVDVDPTLSIQGEAADAKAVGDSIASISSSMSDIGTGLDAVKVDIYGTNVINSAKIYTKTSDAVTNNGDGTYTIGTTDYGTIIFDKALTLQAGRYLLYGVPNGFSFVATTAHYSTAIFSNTKSDPLLITIDTAGTYYVGYRNTSSPSASFTIAPYLIQIGIEKKISILEDDCSGLMEDVGYIKDVSIQDYANYSSVWSVGYIDANGAVVRSSLWRTTDYIPVYENTSISYKIAQYSGVRYVAFYDEGKALISTIQAPATSSSVEGQLEFPGGTKYARIGLWLVSDSSPRTDQWISITQIIPYANSEKIDMLDQKIEQHINETISAKYVAEMNDAVAKVRAESDEPSVVFMWVTDIHRYVTQYQTFSDMIQNMKYMASKCPIDFVLDSGDTIQGDADQATSLSYAYDSMSMLRSIGVPVVYAEGNHDNNPYISSATLLFNLKQIYGAFYTSARDVTYNVSENGTDFYFDLDKIGVRFISLNSCNSSVETTYAYGNSTAQWLSSALNTNYHVILAAHVSPVSAHVWSNCSPDNVGSVKSQLDSFVQNGGKLIVLTGHSHVDAEFISPYIEITHVCQKFEKADISTSAYQAITGMIDGIKNPDRSATDYTSDAWSVCVYKVLSKEFSVIRFGAGTDRYIHCEPISPTTLSTKLSGTITWSSSNTNVATVSNGTVTGVATGKCAIIAKDEAGNIEVWVVNVA